MTKVEYHPTTKALLYAGWALPGTSVNAAAWRIVKFTWVGTELDQVLWADGDDALDNVWANRAALTYLPNDILSLEDAALYEFVPAGARPGSAFTVPAAFMKHELWMNGRRFRPVSGVPGAGEYRLTDVNLLVGGPQVGGSEWLVMRVRL